MNIEIDKGGSGYADILIAGPTNVQLIPQDNHIRLQIATKNDGEMSVPVPLGATDNRRLGEWLLAHSILLKDREND